MGELPSPMVGRQANNTGIRAVPAPGPVKIDGNLSDWDLSGRIWSFADIAIRDRYSAETAAMWDKDYLYLAVKFRDPNPLVNTINPQFDPESGWKGDALQLRLLTDWPLWITMWNFSGGQQGVLHRAMWKDVEKVKEGQDITLLTSKPGSVELGEGVEMAFKADADGRGYVQEVRIPWNFLYKKTPEIAAGLTFRMGMEFFWGAAGESVWPVHRYADNLQPGETSREFFWTAKKAWGDVTLLDQGNVEVLSYIPEGAKLQGTIPIQIPLPASAKEFTVVIETPEGQRIRNLGAQLNTELYSQSVKGDQRLVEVLWDGLDDQGKLVAPGKYQARGLSHEGLGADYVMSFFNPGTPPWETGPGGSWGADHGSPGYAAAAGDWNIIGWHFAEGGSGIIGIAPDGLKKWGEKRGVEALAGDEKNVYFISSSWHLSGNLCRLNKKDGAYKPFKLDGKERPFELPMADIFGGADKVPGRVISLASSGTQLALAMTGGKIALLDAETAKLLKTIDAANPTAVAFGPKGELYALADGKLVAVNLESGALRPISTPGLNVEAKKKVESHASVPDIVKKSEPLHPGTLAVDPQGFIGSYDPIDKQVKFFSPEGKFEYAVGKKGGRPLRGDFDEQAMAAVSAVAVDKNGQVWVTENWEYPRRVSVWGRDGKLIRDYIGNTGYAGTGAFLHDEDPTLAYYGPVEMKLDLAKHTWKVTKVLWVPGEGEHFDVPTKTHTHPHRFSRTVNGKKREFMFSPPMRASQPYVVFMEGDQGWRPVAAIGLVGQLSGEVEEKDAKVIRQPEGEFAGHDAWDGYFWNDLNGDGKVQIKEVTFVPVETPTKIGERGKFPIPYLSGWGTRMAPEDLSFVVNGVARYVPIRYTDEGAPVYGPQSIKKLDAPGKGSGDFVPNLADNEIIGLRWEDNFGTRGLYGFNADTGKELWSYPNPFPGVHGSHRAPMPQPGLLIGPLKILGVAALPNQNGHVFGLRGNLGQDFYFTTDGLMIGTVFQDGRLPTLALPAKEEQLFGAPMETYGGGGEPFTGWFGGHSDGKFRLISGLPRQAAMILEMNGFDRIKRFTGPTFEVTAKQLAAAVEANDARATAAKQSAERRYTIVKVAQPLPIDGQGADWKSIPALTIQSPASGFKGKAQIAYDAETLYLAVNVEDPSPWKNEGVDFTRLFKTGDAVDIQLAVASAAKPDREQPAKGDLRVVLANLNKKPAAVLMQPVNPSAPDSVKKSYTSPVGSKDFDEVRILPDARVAMQKIGNGYRLEAAIPLKELGLAPKAGTEIRGDVGFISSDADGRINTARTYWANEATNLVNDEPFESWLSPAKWGTFTFGK